MAYIREEELDSLSNLIARSPRMTPSQMIGRTGEHLGSFQNGMCLCAFASCHMSYNGRSVWNRKWLFWELFSGTARLTTAVDRHASNANLTADGFVTGPPVDYCRLQIPVL